MALRDIGLFLKSAGADRAIARLRDELGNDELGSDELGNRLVFETVYRELGDPWASADRRYWYQARKYQRIVECLPAGRQFRQALDLGCGLGQLSRKLAERTDHVFGIDIAKAAVEEARRGSRDNTRLSFDQGDVQSLPASLDGGFDLVAIADTLCYLPPPIQDQTLKTIAARVARLLEPGGLCLLVNHYFFSGDPESRLSRRIHNAFTWSLSLTRMSETRRPFYLVTVLSRDQT
jgi:SAM-dependent methyltransferase